MKRFLCVLLVTAVFFLTPGCAKSDDKSFVLPPTRISTSGESHALLAQHYTFSSAFSDSDLVARVEIGDWLGEDTEGWVTYYDATLLHCYKGDAPDTFVLLQDGCSTSTMEGYPLFTGGNELFLFLKEAVFDDYGQAYWIIGSFTTVMDVSYDSNGTRYYADHYGILGETVEDSTNYALQSDIAKEVYSYAAKTDSIVELMQYQYPYIFSETDLAAVCENMK